MGLRRGAARGGRRGRVRTGVGSRAAVTALASVLALLLALVWVGQRQLVYHPDATEVPAADDVVDGARDVILRTADGLELGAWFVPPDPVRDRGTAVLLAPGNGGNRATRAGLAQQLRARGLAVLLLDYRGYGGNPGSPTEAGLAADADAAVRALAELGYQARDTVYLGESIGTGVVASLQTRHPPAGVVLRSPFTSLADAGSHHYPWLPVRTLLRDRYPVLALVAAQDVPTVVVHGLRDRVVPPAQSERVADAAPRLVEHLILDADHNDPLMSGAEVADAVERLVASLDRA